MLLMIDRDKDEEVNKQKQQHRSKEEIITHILIPIKNEKGIRKTKLMFLSGMSNTQLKKYLDYLQNNGLIKPGPTIHEGRGVPGQTFHITTKGLSYLQMVDEMKKNMGIKI